MGRPTSKNQFFQPTSSHVEAAFVERSVLFPLSSGIEKCWAFSNLSSFKGNPPQRSDFSITLEVKGGIFRR